MHITYAAWTTEELWVRTFVLDEVLAVCGYIGHCDQLLNTRYYTSWETSGWLIAVNQHSVCTSVTDNCQTNSIFVCHVTRDNKGGQTFTTIRIDDVRNTYSSRITVLDWSAGVGYKKVYIIIFMFQFPQQNSKRTKLSQKSPWFKFIFLLPGNCKTL